MAITPTLKTPTTVSVKAGQPIDFVLLVSGSSGPFTLSSIQVQVWPTGTATNKYANYQCAAVSPIPVGLPLNTSVINTNTGTFSFQVVINTPQTSSAGSSAGANVVGSGVFAVQATVFESTTPGAVTSNIVYVTSSALKTF